MQELRPRLGSLLRDGNRGESFVPKDGTLLSVIEYPDLTSAQQSVAGILALRTLEFVSIEELRDVVEFTQLVRKAAASG